MPQQTSVMYRGLVDNRTAYCPYCGEPNEISIDTYGGAVQRYVEDCQVCCQPWNVTVRQGEDIEIELRTLDE